MAKNDFSDMEVERTTRWVEHEEIQKNKRTWTGIMFAVPVVLIAVVWIGVKLLT